MAELNAALNLTPERRNGNINLSEYFISSSEGRTHNQSVLQSHLVPLRHDWPQYTIFLYTIVNNNNNSNDQLSIQTRKSILPLPSHSLVYIQKKVSKSYHKLSLKVKPRNRYDAIKKRRSALAVNSNELRLRDVNTKYLYCVLVQVKNGNVDRKCV